MLQEAAARTGALARRRSPVGREVGIEIPCDASDVRAARCFAGGVRRRGDLLVVAAANGGQRHRHRRLRTGCGTIGGRSERHQIPDAQAAQPAASSSARTRTHQQRWAQRRWAAPRRSAGPPRAAHCCSLGAFNAYLPALLLEGRADLRGAPPLKAARKASIVSCMQLSCCALRLLKYNTRPRVVKFHG